MKGHTNNPKGRPAGVPNRVTTEMRQILKSILADELDRLPDMLAALPDEKRLDVVMRLLPYVIPRPNSVSASYGEAGTFSTLFD